MIIGGGGVSIFDGELCTEAGFNVFPEGLSATWSSGSGDIDEGTYSYVAVYSWSDANGQTHRSAPTPTAVSVDATASGGKISVNIPTLSLTNKQNVLIELYRTTANADQYYLCSPHLLASSDSLNYVTYVDTMSDDDLIGQLQLYTNGGEVPNGVVNPSDIQWTYNNRIFYVYSEYPTTVGYSKQVIGGEFSSPVEFSPYFSILVPEEIGKVTAGIQMDDKCLIFGPRSIFYMVGQGPSPNGQNNDFTTPTVISSDCGCIDPKSLVLIPIGVMFKSEKGIYLIDRSLNVQYVGADVEGYNQYGVTSAQMINKLNQIRFTLDNGVCLVYDYLFKQWSVFENIDAVDSCLFNGTFCYASDSKVGLESDHYSNLDGSPILMGFKTSWFSFGEVQGFQRAKRLLILGKYYSPHSLNVKFRTDFKDDVVQEETIDVPSSINPYQFRIHLSKQKCESFQIEVNELSESAGRGLSLSALLFQVGAKRGPNKMGASKTYG